MKRCLFSLVAPGAKDVRLAGDFTDWDKKALAMDRMKPRSRTFAVILDLPPGRYEYKFIVDGEWRTDPDAGSAPNEFGGENSVIWVKAA
jgi:1,4-alpha-glucan branching enzyme